jgi:hypothetical protein
MLTATALERSAASMAEQVFACPVIGALLFASVRT